MELHVSWTGVGVMLAILAHGASTIWWASKLTEKFDNINQSLSRIDKELEKRDDQLGKMWERLDELRDMIK